MRNKRARVHVEAPKYEIIRRVGDGATATVFRAERVDSRGMSRQTVALKILKGQKFVQQLRREFATLTSVDSLHCVRVLAWENLSHGSAALVLEWIEGVTLYELGRFGQLESNWAGLIQAQAEAGLRALDKNGLHHGDIHPNNILIDCQGVVRLVDFGVADRTSGVACGMPAYFAPEVWQGCASSIASDLFSLALVIEDFRSEFCAVPSDSSAARRRCERMIWRSSSKAPIEAGPLTEDASVRCYSREVYQAGSPSLGRRVQEILKARESFRTERVALSQTRSGAWLNPQFSLRSRPRLMGLRAAASIALVMLMAVSVPVLADDPRLSESGRASLEVRSRHWLILSLDGRTIGYTPVRIREIAAGHHVLSWRGANSAGQMALELTAGEIKRLREGDDKTLK